MRHIREEEELAEEEEEEGREAERKRMTLSVEIIVNPNVIYVHALKII